MIRGKEEEEGEKKRTTIQSHQEWTSFSEPHPTKCAIGGFFFFWLGGLPLRPRYDAACRRMKSGSGQTLVNIIAVYFSFFLGFFLVWVFSFLLFPQSIKRERERGREKREEESLRTKGALVSCFRNP